MRRLLLLPLLVTPVLSVREAAAFGRALHPGWLCRARLTYQEYAGARPSRHPGESPRQNPRLHACSALSASAATLSSERVILRTTLGDLVLALYEDTAPANSAQLLRLARMGLYDSAHFFKVDPTFAIQISGAGKRRLPITPEQAAALHPLKAELSSLPHRYGTVTMAHDPGQPDTAQMSFLIMLADVKEMDGKFTVVGEVVEGKDVLEAIRNFPTDSLQQPVQRIEIEKAIVVDTPAALAAVPRKKTDSTYAPAEGEPMPEWFLPAGLALSVVGVLLASLSLVLRGPVTHPLRAVGFLAFLSGLFLLFTVSLPNASASPLAACAIFLGTFGLFRLMSAFEEAVAPLSGGPPARSGGDSGGPALSVSPGRHAAKSRSGRS